MKTMSMHSHLVRRFSFLLALVATLFIPLVSFGATGSIISGAFIIKPAKVELTLAPGEKKETTLTLSNNTPLPLHVDISFEDVGANMQASPDDEPVKLLGTQGGEYSLHDLFSISRSSFDLLSGKEVEVPVSIAIPRDAEAGGRYGSVVFTFHPVAPPGAPQPANVAIESRIATLFFVRVSGDAKEEGKLVAFGLFNNARSVSAPSSDHPLRFQVAYENTGNVHLDPYGGMTLSSFFGNKKIVPIDPWVVLPGATRMREVSISDLPVGYYHARIELNRGYKDVVDDREVSFWVLPTARQLFFSLIAMLLLALLVRKSLRISKNRAF